MLNGVIGDVLPSAVAVALSPIPVVAVVVVLGGRAARTAGPAFAAGWGAGLLAVSVVVLLLVSAAELGGSEDAGLVWWKIAVGVLFLWMAAKQWAKRSRPGEQPREPGWMATVDRASAPRAAALGVALSAANPKNLALTLTAAASIAEAGLARAEAALAVAVFVGVGSLAVTGAVAFHLLAGEHAVRPLAVVKQFMAANSQVIMMVVLLLLGAKLLGDGIGGL